MRTATGIRIGAGGLGVLLACGGNEGTGPISVASITVTPHATTVNLFDSVPLNAVARDAQGNVMNVTIRWSSSAPLAIPVNAAGLVNAFGRGSVRITASADAQSDTSRVSVVAPIVQLSIIETDFPLLSGNSAQLTLALAAVDGGPPTDTIVTWTSSAIAVAQVSPTGLVTAVAQGMAIIRATAASGPSDSVRVTVLNITAIGRTTRVADSPAPPAGSAFSPLPSTASSPRASHRPH